MNSLAIAADDMLAIDPRSVPVRYSNLKRMAQSPAHYLFAVQRTDDVDSLPLRLGRGVHSYLLEVPDRIAVYKGRRAGKAWDEFCAENKDREILNEREDATAQAIARAVRTHKSSNGPSAPELLFDRTVMESRIDWSVLGRACRSTPDAFRIGSHVVDIKTTRCAEPEKFTRQAHAMHYHGQLAFYCQAIEYLTGEPPPEAYLVAVESTPPHPVTVCKLTPSALDMGARLCRMWFERLLVCEESNVWPGYTDAVCMLDIADDSFSVGSEDEPWEPT